MTQQVLTLFLLALPIACIAWTVTHEEVFREPRDYCKKRCAPDCRPVVKRKFFYLFTCEYCFSHYVTALVLIFTGFKFPFAGWWIDYVLTGFTLVYLANIYMSLYFRLRLSVKRTGAEAKLMDNAAREL